MGKPILIVHPNDKTTSFLDKIKNHLVHRFPDKLHHFNIYPNDESHAACMQKIKSTPEDSFIIFFGHGRTDKLYGSKGNDFDNRDLVSIEAIAEHPEQYYYNDNFINEKNVEVFAGKKVFCLACNSNDKISNYAFNKGVHVFLGFGDIPTSVPEFKEDGIKNVSNDIVKLIKTELNYIIKRSLEIGIENNFKFFQLRDIIQFITNQRISYYLRIKKTSHDRNVLADYLYKLKSEIKIVGNKNAKIFE